MIRLIPVLAVAALATACSATSITSTGTTIAGSGPCHEQGSGLFVTPDRSPGCTPGMWISDPAIKKTPAASEYDPNVSDSHVCSKGYNPRPGTDVSGPLKDEADKLYGFSTSINRKVEADHLYPRWLGGATVLQNFWPQPNWTHPKGFDHNSKDVLELRLFDLTCKEYRLTVSQARTIFEGSWLNGYRKYIGPTQ